MQNFGSYANLDIDFSNLGLALIYGSTGAGKSTVMDIACWILYGITAKGGKVDEVRSWQSPYGDATTGVLDVELGDGKITVTRTRGRAKQNDLFWIESGFAGAPFRGKDLTETQKLLETRLGVSSELYRVSAYYHEFSPSGQFFTANAKDQRTLFERVTELATPAKLAERSSQLRKDAKIDLCTEETARAKLTGRLEQLLESHADAVRLASKWESSQAQTIANLEVRSKGFEAEKANTLAKLLVELNDHEVNRQNSVQQLSTKIIDLNLSIWPDSRYGDSAATIVSERRCSQCGALPEAASKALSSLMEDKAANDRRKDLLDRYNADLGRLAAHINPYTQQIQQARLVENTYAEQLKNCREAGNPHTLQCIELDRRIQYGQRDLDDLIFNASALEYRVAQLSRLYDLSFVFRGQLLSKAIEDVQNATNGYLSKYFDAELTVTFRLNEDELQVTVSKSGYDCVYHQLSKGQRGLLKLCFSIAVQNSAANAAGVHFDNLFFDESLDGLDPDLKVKAYSLFESLSLDHKSVLIIEHTSEFKELFSSKYAVTLEGDQSRMELE